MMDLIHKPSEMLSEFGRSALDDPLKVFRFIVEVDGFARFGFSEVMGLEMDTEYTEYREGGDNATTRKSAGLMSSNNITLKRGQIIGGSEGGEDDFLAWYNQVFQVTAKGASMDYRKTIDIVQYHRDGTEARRWRVYECAPKRFKPFSDLNATSNDDSIEELEIVNEGWEKVSEAA